MRKIILGLLSLIYLVYPLSVSAGAFDVGITINKKDVIIDVDTTIATNIIIDEEEKTTVPSYVYFENNGNTNIEITVTDIESAFSSAPSTFQNYSATTINDKAWKDFDETETKTHIAFGISANGSGYTSVFPSTEINLGYLSNDTTYSTYFLNTFNGNTRVFELNVKTGYNWGDTKNLYYRITFVVAPAGPEYDSDPINLENTVAARYGDLDGEVPTFDYITRKDYGISDDDTEIKLRFMFNHNTGLNVETEVQVYADLEITSDVKERYELNDQKLDFVAANNNTWVNVPGSTGDPEQDELLFGSSLYGSFGKSISAFAFDTAGTYTIKLTLTIHEKETVRTINQLMVYKKS